MLAVYGFMPFLSDRTCTVNQLYFLYRRCRRWRILRVPSGSVWGGGSHVSIAVLLRLLQSQCCQFPQVSLRLLQQQVGKKKVRLEFTYMWWRKLQIKMVISHQTPDCPVHSAWSKFDDLQVIRRVRCLATHQIGYWTSDDQVSITFNLTLPKISATVG